MLSEVESLRVQSLWLLKKALPSREEPDISSVVTPYVGMTPQKNGGHIKSAQMTRSKCPR